MIGNLRTRLSSTERAALSRTVAETDPQLDRLLEKILWFVAGIGVVRTLIAGPLGDTGTDFVPIWEAVQRYVHGVPVYNEDYSTRDPHYLYSPGANVLLAPLAVLGSFGVARWFSIVVSQVAIVAAIYMAARLLTSKWHKFLALATIGFFFNTSQPVVSTLALTNINGILLLLMVVFTYLCINTGRPGIRQFGEMQTYAAGFLLATAVTIKPQFIVLWVLPVVLMQWPTLVVGVVIAALLFGIGWVTTAQPQLYAEKLLPYLAQPRDYDNGALKAVMGEYGLDGPAQLIAFIGISLAVLAGFFLLLPMRKRDPYMWAFCTLGILFAGVFLNGGLLQGYYSMWLIPMAMTIVRPHSPARLIPFWLAFLLINGALEDLTLNWLPGPSTLGWIALVVVTVFWVIKKRRTFTQ